MIPNAVVCLSSFVLRRNQENEAAPSTREHRFRVVSDFTVNFYFHLKAFSLLKAHALSGTLARTHQRWSKFRHSI